MAPASRWSTVWAALILFTGAPAPSRAQLAPAGARLSDEELAAITGKFVLPNGVELALSVTSDTVVNGQLILRTVLTVDRTAQVQVFGRTGQTPTTPYIASGTASGSVSPGGVTVALDRQSGLQSVTPTFSVTHAPAVSVGSIAQTSEALGLTQVPITPGGPAIATADGLVSLQSVNNGSQVTFAGDRLAVVNLVGSSVGTALANSGNDRTLDTVTSVAIDARNLAPYQIGAAQMRVDALVTDVTRSLAR